MKYPNLLLVAMAITAIPAVLRAQGFHRYLPIGHTEAICKPSSDGGLFARFFFQPGRPLVKLDEAGEVVWAKSIPDLTAFIPDPDGGVVLIRPSDGIQQPPDSNYDSFLLQRLNTGGEMVMNRRVILEESGETSNRLEAAAWTSDGQLYLCLEDISAAQQVLKFNTNGELLWVRPTYGIGEDSYGMKALPDGGVMVYDTWYSDLGSAWRFGPDGELIWFRNLNVNAPAFMTTGGALLVDDEGGLLMTFTANSPTQPGPTQWVVLGKMDVDANMLWSYAYHRAPGGSMISFDDMETHVPSRILPNGNFYFGTVKGFEFTSQGLFVREKTCTSPTLAPGFDDITHSFTTLPTADGWMQYGRRRWTDPGFGYFVQMPLLGLTPIELDSTCFWTCDERTDIIALQPPPDIFTTSNSLHPSHWVDFNTESWPVQTLVDVTMDLLEDACELPEIVEFSTSVGDLDPITPLLLYPNPLLAGQSIQVDAAGPLVLEVIDARGRVLESNRYHFGSSVIATSGWDAGLYLLRASLPDGRVVHTRRLLVQ